MGLPFWCAKSDRRHYLKGLLKIGIGNPQVASLQQGPQNLYSWRYPVDRHSGNRLIMLQRGGASGTENGHGCIAGETDGPSL